MPRRLLVAIASVALVLAVSGAAAAVPRWSSVKVPADSRGAVSSISCVNAANCSALGESTFVRWDGARLAPLPRFRGAASTPTAGLACPGRWVCMAVGGASGASASAARFSRGRWRPLAVKTDLAPARRAHPHAHLVSELDSISCPSRRACVAVGGLLAFGTRFEVPILERWNGGGWLPMRLPVSGISLASVSCASKGSCVAVGSTDRDGRVSPVALRLRGRRWSPIHLPAVPGLQANLNAVSCRASGCVAVGQAFRKTPAGAQIGRGLVISGRDGAWRVDVLHPPSPAGGKGASSEELADVSCPAAAAGPCVAVGSWFKGERPAGGLSVSVDRGLVRQSRLAVDRDPTAIDCPAATFCLAAGDGSVERLGR